MATRVATLVRKIYQEQLESATPPSRTLETISAVIGVCVAVLFIIGAIINYNGLVQTSTYVQEDSAQIRKEIKRRQNLIPNLISIVKNYAVYERAVFSHTSDSRQMMMKYKQLEEGMNGLEKVDIKNALSKILAISEQYPSLKADITFSELMRNLETSENRIADARAKYNHDVNIYNTYRAKFPTFIYAAMFGYKEYPFGSEHINEGIPLVHEFNQDINTKAVAGIGKEG